MEKKKLLLHVCCGPCSTEVVMRLMDEYDVTLFFYNPNIEPIEEYEKRVGSAAEFANKLGLKFIEGEYDNENFRDAVKGHEAEPENGPRCEICYRLRLERTAEIAKQKGFYIFTTTLTISPHKDALIINDIGNEVAGEKLTLFLEENFKKQNGFRNSIELSKKYGLYRQNYCGCLFSKKIKI